MEVHEFYAKYPNTKMLARIKPIKVTGEVKRYNCGLPLPETLTLVDIHNEVDRLEEIVRPMRLRQETLIAMARKHMMENQA